jgi:GTP-binding protein
MHIKSARFVISNKDYKKSPAPVIPEYAFIGRSNVGKSSLINMITGVKHLAKTSSTPGKTQLINHFLINDAWYLVDLPGYGYARTNKTLKAGFSEMIQQYISHRPNLMNLFLLLDIRHEPQKTDLDFIRWIGRNQVPFIILFTKADKLNKSQVSASRKRYESVLLEEWENLPPIIVTSSETKAGKDEILLFIEQANKLFSPPPKIAP